MEWLSPAIALVRVLGRKPLLPLALLSFCYLFWVDTGGLLTYLQETLHDEIRIRSLAWYFGPWLLGWLIWSLDAILGTGTRLGLLCPDLVKLLQLTTKMDGHPEKQEYAAFAIEAFKVRQALSKMTIPTVDILVSSEDSRAGAGLQAWRKFLVRLIALAIEKDYLKAQELLSNPKLLETLNFNEDEMQLLPSEPPVTPKNLKSSVNQGKVTLTWELPSGPVTGYQILRRCLSLGEKRLQVYETDTGSDMNTFDDENTSPGQRYGYCVRTISGTDLSKSSSQTNVTVPKE